MQGETAGPAAGGLAAAALAGAAGAEATPAAPGPAAGGGRSRLQAGPRPAAPPGLARMTAACHLLTGVTPAQLRLPAPAPSAPALAACNPMGELRVQVLLSAHSPLLLLLLAECGKASLGCDLI